MITWNLLCILSVSFSTRAAAEGAEEGLAAVASALATVQPQGEGEALPVFVVGSEGTGCCDGGNVSHSLGLARRLQAKRAMRGELFFFRAAI